MPVTRTNRPTSADPLDKARRQEKHLRRLRKDGRITEEEFEWQFHELLRRAGIQPAWEQTPKPGSSSLTDPVPRILAALVEAVEAGRLTPGKQIVWLDPDIFAARRGLPDSARTGERLLAVNVPGLVAELRDRGICTNVHRLGRLLREVHMTQPQLVIQCGARVLFGGQRDVRRAVILNWYSLTEIVQHRQAAMAGSDGAAPRA